MPSSYTLSPLISKCKHRPCFPVCPARFLRRLLTVIFLGGAAYAQTPSQHLAESGASPTPLPFEQQWVVIPKDIRIANYFPFLDSLVASWTERLPYPLSEHLLVQANPWIIDTLANTDYYRRIARDSFVYEQPKMRVLKAGDSLRIPDSETAEALLKKMRQTHLDVNIPEFTLRIYQDSMLLHAFPIRVGQNRRRFLKTAGRELDLRTKTGQGIIVAHNRDPDFYNPVDGKRFYLTKRDDGKTTVMPQIPWMDTSINGIRHGQMIHPTTNPETLGKAYSNGCIGLEEAASWIVYYHAPLGTRIRIRYALKVRDANGQERLLRDIYGYY